jgi:hypothetical protein
MQIAEDDRRMARISRLGKTAAQMRAILPTVSIEPKHPIRDAIEVLSHVAVAQGLQVGDLNENCGAPAGTCHDTTIAINRWIEPGAQLVSLVHQLVHAFDYRGRVATMDVWDHEEVVAEAIGLLTTEWLGFELEELSLVMLASNEASWDNFMALAFRIVEVSPRSASYLRQVKVCLGHVTKERGVAIAAPRSNIKVLISPLAIATASLAPEHPHYEETPGIQIVRTSPPQHDEASDEHETDYEDDELRCEDHQSLPSCRGSSRDIVKFNRASIESASAP